MHRSSHAVLRGALWALPVFLGLSLSLPALAAFAIPPNDGFVTDAAGVLTKDQKTQLESQLNDYRTKTSNEIAVLIIKSLSGAVIEDVGVQVGRAWGVGTKDKSNGILMLISLEDRAITIQTGYGLEGAVPDVVAKGVIDTDITPHFRDGDYFKGIAAGIDALEKHIGGEYTADRYTASSSSGFFPFLFFVLFVLLNALGSFLGRSSSWWLGGVIGGVCGIILTVLFGWWLSIPLLVILGLIFDFIVSKMPKNGRRGRGGFWGGGFGGGGFGGGGGGGFGGGSFGGGGASGKW